MVHSTGVAQPDPEAFCRQWDRPGVDACVHAFVAEDRIVQTLPWNWRGWHAGRGTLGSANNTHISFGILRKSMKTPWTCAPSCAGTTPWTPWNRG